MSSQYNIDNFSLNDSNHVLFTNSIVSFILFTIFSTILVITSSNVIKSIIKAKDNAEKQKDTKTRVLSNLGHELRTQLSSIHGITQLILEHNENDDLSHHVFSDYTGTLKVCTNQMLFLVNDILDIHNIEYGSFKLNSKPDNLYLLLNSVTTPFNSTVLDKNLNFKVSIDPILKEKHIIIDSFRLTQVIQNLISNAIKFTDKGHIGFSADVKFQDEEIIEILFSIKDSGIGISTDNLTKIFDSFHQIRDNDTPNTGGTGLGLAISKTIVEKMGSQLKVSSTPNIGSDFNFSLRLKKVPYNKNPKNDASNVLKPNLNGKKILIAEDNKISMLYASKLLEKYDAEVYKAYNGEEAIDITRKHPEITIVLLDLEMPVMNGFVAIKQLKKINEALKVIAFTANIPDDNLNQKLKQLNFDGFLAKPFKNEEMFSILDKHL